MFILLLIIPFVVSQTVSIEEFADGNKLFSASLYQELGRTQKGNFLVSPFSIQTALALVHSGAKDDTAQEIRSTVKLPNKVEETFQNLLPTLKSKKLYNLLSANKIYVKEGFEIKKEFKKSAVDVFQADIENIDFSKKVTAAKSINSWVEEQTNDKIRDLLSSDDLSPSTRLIIINTLYFQGNWSHDFSSSATTKKEFYKIDKKSVLVDTMHKTAMYNYHKCNDLNAKFLEIPFEGNDAVMVIVLPNEQNGITNLQNEILRVFAERNYTRELISLSLPKFKIESSFNVEDVLQELGLKKAFSSEEADFSGIAGDKGALVIDKVKQKTFIDVAEKGVEAAAATSIEFVFTSAIIDPKPAKEFVVDRPFIFYIKVQNLILFGGRVFEL